MVDISDGALVAGGVAVTNQLPRELAVAQSAPRLSSIQVSTAAEELELRPTEGMARWLGRWLYPLALRAGSVIEQPHSTMDEAVTPTRAYYRRDRHRHPRIDPANWRLRVSGVVASRELALQDLCALPSEERVCVMECAGNGEDLMGSADLIAQARWTGPSFETVLAACGGSGDATHFAFHGLDRIPLLRHGYHFGLSLEELRRSRAIVALAINGETLPRERGFPARLVAPGIYGMSHVKWLSHIEGKTAPHTGIYNRRVYTNEELIDGQWRRVQVRWVGLKSMVTHCRRIDGGWRLSGWAWGGGQRIAGVEVTTDGGKTWSAAEVQAPEELLCPDLLVDEPGLAHAWSAWSWRWHAPSKGEYEIGSRARGDDGSLQPLERSPRVRGHCDHTSVKWRRVSVP